MSKIRKGDQVVVITGKDKGKQGVVLRVLESSLLVEGVNQAKKHQKPNPVRGVEGGIVVLNRPIHVSNVAIWNPATKSADRIGYKFLEDGKKVRVFKSSGALVDA